MHFRPFLVSFIPFFVFLNPISNRLIPVCVHINTKKEGVAKLCHTLSLQYSRYIIWYVHDIP